MLRNHEEASYYLMTILMDSTAEQLQVGLNKITEAKFSTRLTNSLVEKFAEAIVPLSIFLSYQTTGKLRLVDWQSILEIAYYIGFDVSNRVKALNDEIAKSGNSALKVEITSIETKILALKMSEEQVLTSFKDELARCLEILIDSFSSNEIN